MKGYPMMMSRIGRNYLQVGFYTDVMFREKNVRFIAISNNVDSINGDNGNEFAPFLNIMNEWYVRDISRKIKAVLHTKGNSGQHLTGNVIYGYMKYPCDRQTWVCLLSQMAASMMFVFLVILLGMKVRIGNKVLAFMGTITLEFYLVHGLFVELFSYSFVSSLPSIYRITNIPLYILVVLVPSIPLVMLLHKGMLLVKKMCDR